MKLTDLITAGGPPQMARGVFPLGNVRLRGVWKSLETIFYSRWLARHVHTKGCHEIFKIHQNSSKFIKIQQNSSKSIEILDIHQNPLVLYNACASKCQHCVIFLCEKKSFFLSLVKKYLQTIGSFMFLNTLQAENPHENFYCVWLTSDVMLNATSKRWHLKTAKHNKNFRAGCRPGEYLKT